MVRQLPPPDVPVDHLQAEREEGQKSGSWLGLGSGIEQVTSWQGTWNLDLDLRGKGVWVGKKIGNRIPGCRIFTGEFFYSRAEIQRLRLDLISPLRKPTTSINPLVNA